MRTSFSKCILGAGAIALVAQGLAVATAQAQQAVKPKVEFVGKNEMPDINVPPGYEEGYLPKLSDIDVKEVEQFAKNSSADLRDLTDLASKIPDYWEKRTMLRRGIDEIIKKSQPLKTELLMRNVLERAVIMVNLIDTEVQNDIKRKGVVDQEVRLMNESIRMAFAYWEPYLKHINGQTVQANVDLSKINYRDFGVKYANLLWSVANSIFDASAEYKLRLESLKLLMWDLYRDENKLELNQAGAITKIYTYVKNAPDTSTWTDDQYVERVKLLRIIHNEAYARLGEAGPNPALPASAPPAEAPALKDASPVRVNCSILYPGHSDGQSRVCSEGTGFGIMYEGYFISTSPCNGTIGAALTQMYELKVCSMSSTRGRCKLLAPGHSDGQSRSCEASHWGVMYNGYFKSNTCYDSVEKAMNDMLSDPSCQ